MDMGCHIMDQMRQLEVSMEIQNTAYRAHRYATFKSILDRLIEETPLLKGVITSDLFLESEQKFSDVA